MGCNSMGGVFTNPENEHICHNCVYQLYRRWIFVLFRKFQDYNKASTATTLCKASLKLFFYPLHVITFFLVMDYGIRKMYRRMCN